VVLEVDPCGGVSCYYYIHFCFKCEVSYDGVGPGMPGKHIMTLHSYYVVPGYPESTCSGCQGTIYSYVASKMASPDWWKFFGDSLCTIYSGVQPCTTPTYVYLDFPECWNATLDYYYAPGVPIYSMKACPSSPWCTSEWTVCFNTLTQSYDWEYIGQYPKIIGTPCSLVYDQLNFPSIFPTTIGATGSCFHYPGVTCP